MSVDFSMTRGVSFAETDMAGVLHFSNYFRLMEEVEHAFWRSMNMAIYAEGKPDRIVSWPRVAAACEYFAPARFEDQMQLNLNITHVGNRSVGYEIEFLRGSERLALGKLTAVCCEMKPDAFTPIPIPDEIRAKLTKQTEAASTVKTGRKE